jgi:hypothetical protein
MATITSGQFDGDDARAIDLFIARLVKILSHEDQSPETVLNRLEALLLGKKHEEQSSSNKQLDELGKQLNRVEAFMQVRVLKRRSFSTAEIASLEKVRPGTVRDWIRAGKLRAIPDPNYMAGPHPRLKIRLEDYEQFKNGGVR